MSPPPEAPSQSAERLGELALAPVLELLHSRGTPFRGALFAGLMLTPTGPKVLEYNCRLGDPETQVLMERLEGDLGQALLAAARGELGGVRLAERPVAAVGVVACAEGYPGLPRLGDPIEGLDGLYEAEGALLLFGGVGGTVDRPVTAGGRVFTAVGTSASLTQARENALRLLRTVRFRGLHHRTDIGVR